MATTTNPFLTPEVLNKVDVNINSSTSKQMYSFPKGNRFKELRKTSETLFYNLPSTKSHRFAAFGFGGRSDFTSGLLKNKAQVYYEIPSDFNTRLRNGHSPQYSFGKGREDCKRPTNNIDKNDPGPGAYNVRKPLGSDALKFSLFGRGWDKIDNFRLTRNLPGPGHYNEKLAINGNGKYPTSTFGNTHQLGFARTERFKVKYNKYPGPGTYENDTIFNQTGYHCDSKWGSNMAKTMHERPPQFYAGFKMSTEPGPGSYDFFSDFEGFQRAGKVSYGKRGKRKNHSRSVTEGNVRESKSQRGERPKREMSGIKEQNDEEKKDNESKNEHDGIEAVNESDKKEDVVNENNENIEKENENNENIEKENENNENNENIEKENENNEQQIENNEQQIENNEQQNENNEQQIENNEQQNENNNDNVELQNNNENDNVDLQNENNNDNVDLQNDNNNDVDVVDKEVEEEIA